MVKDHFDRERERERESPLISCKDSFICTISRGALVATRNSSMGPPCRIDPTMYVCMYICMYICMYVCLYVCIYVCVYVCVRACGCVLKELK